MVLVLCAALTPVGAVLAGYQPGSVALRLLGVAVWLALGAASARWLLRPRGTSSGPREMSTRAAGALFLGAALAFLLGTSLAVVLVAAVELVLTMWLLAHAVRPASARLRKVLLAVHLVCTGAWLGIGAVMVALALIGARTGDEQTSASAYRFMEIFDQTVLPMGSVSGTLSGVFLAFVTKWGVFRHYWVVVKLVLAVAVFAAAFLFLHDAVVRAAGHGDVPTSLAVLLIGGFLTAFAAIVAATVISVYKPWGRTGRGRREAERRAAGAWGRATATTAQAQ
ncbi:hypothetical protein ABGB07_04065 [Micromonosporaceae bacterium B7E4]